MRAKAVVRWRDLRSARAIPMLQILYPASSAWLQLRFVLLPLLDPGHRSLRLWCLNFRLRELDFIPRCNILLDLGAGAWNMGRELLNSKGGAKTMSNGSAWVEGKGVRDWGTTVCVVFLIFEGTRLKVSKGDGLDWVS
jgi:hypothetical protein